MARISASRQNAFAKLRNQLLDRQRLLRRTLRDDLHGLGEYHIARNSDLLDAAADTISDAVNTGLIRNETEELSAIADAIDRIDAGDYGTCQCGKSIPLQRLRAVPYATDCIDCRRAAESRLGGLVGSWFPTHPPQTAV